MLTKAHERVDEKRREKMRGLLEAGDPNGEVADCYTAKEAVREPYSFVDFKLAHTWIDNLVSDMKSSTWPLEVRARAHAQELARRDHCLAQDPNQQRSDRRCYSTTI